MFFRLQELLSTILQKFIENGLQLEDNGYIKLTDLFVLLDNR